MAKSKYLTNQDLLFVLWDRLPTFTREEWIILMKILGPHQTEIMKMIQSYSPQVHDWIQEKHQQLEQAKTDKKMAKMKNNLANQTTMPKSKKLQKQIENKLDQLHKLIDKINEAKAINSDDPDTWDTDTLYGLVENCKEVIKLLEDQKGKQLDEFGEPIILEAGICSLVDSYHSEDEAE